MHENITLEDQVYAVDAEQPHEEVGADLPTIEDSHPLEDGMPEDLQGWLERRNIDPAEVHRVSMNAREFRMFSSYPVDSISHAREIYGLNPGHDQEGIPFAFVTVAPEEPDEPPRQVLVDITNRDFGTTISGERVKSDFEGTGQSPDAYDPDDPSHPDRPNSGYRIIDIRKALGESVDELRYVAHDIMQGVQVDPLTAYGEVGVRAGSLEPGQTDAFYWTSMPFTKSVELTLAFPNQYDSVVIISGQSREAMNGKAGMAQMDNPQEVLKIEGARLKELQEVYRDLHVAPDYALSESQRRERDDLFNDFLSKLISNEAKVNAYNAQIAQEEAQYDRYEDTGPKYRERTP